MYLLNCLQSTSILLLRWSCCSIRGACKGGGKFVIASYGEYNTGASCCYRRYGNAAMTTGLHEGTTRYRRSMFDDDSTGSGVFPPGPSGSIMYTPFSVAPSV